MRHVVRPLRPLRSLLALALVASVGCASGGTRPASRGDRNVLMHDEVVEAATSSGVDNLYDVVRLRRPQWLIIRGTTTVESSEPDIAVYDGSLRLGGPGALKDIRVASVVSVRYLSGSEAQTRFGLDNTNGAIVVETRPPQ